MKKKLILLFSVLLFAVVLYNFFLNNWIKDYNEEQWNTYVQSFSKVTEVAEPYNECLVALERNKNSMQESYEKGIAIGRNTLTAKEVYEYNMYSFLRRVIENTSKEVGYYTRETPVVKAGIFILDSWSLKNLVLNPFAVANRIPETKESLSWHTGYFENHEIPNIEKLYCPADIVKQDDFFDYPLSAVNCTELLKIDDSSKYSIERKPQREKYELEIEYQKALERYESALILKQQNILNLCNDQEFRLDFSRG